MDSYNADIDYKSLLTRYLRYLYRDWIANAEIAARYPHMVGHAPCKWSASEMIAELDKMGID